MVPVHFTSGLFSTNIGIFVLDPEAVGYGDPLIAVLPSFHGIK